MPICNGCGADTDTSREHLIHRNVGEAILGVRGHPDTNSMRRQLLRNYVRFAGGAGEVDHTGVRLDGTIANLVCRACNAGWANDLEADAGQNLYGFLHENGPLDLPLFLRWLVFFYFKAHMYYVRPDQLASGPLTDLFSTIRDPLASSSIRVFGARLIVTDIEAWQFMFHQAPQGGEVAAGFTLVTHAVLWFIPFETTPPLPLLRLRDRCTLAELPHLSASSLYGSLLPHRTVDVLGEHVEG